MANYEYHKGSFCSYNSVFRQEGYCAECEIYWNRLSTKKAEYQFKTRDVRKLCDIVTISVHS
jgi:hypothetical protein